MIKSLISRAFRSNNPKSVELRPAFPGYASNATLAEVPSLSFDPSNFEAEIQSGGFSVRIKNGLKRMTLFRFLTAKLLYETEEGLHLDEFLVLYSLYYDLWDVKDSSFIEKYDDWFQKTQMFFVSLARSQNFPVRLNKEKMDDEFFQSFEPFLPSKQAYFGLKGQRNIRSSFEIRLNCSLPPQRIKPKRFVGVGYRDKGTRRDLAKDGSPAWQEVSRHNFELDRRAEEELEESKDHLGPPDSS